MWSIHSQTKRYKCKIYIISWYKFEWNYAFRLDFFLCGLVSYVHCNTKLLQCYKTMTSSGWELPTATRGSRYLQYLSSSGRGQWIRTVKVTEMHILYFPLFKLRTFLPHSGQTRLPPLKSISCNMFIHIQNMINKNSQTNPLRQFYKYTELCQTQPN